MQTLPRYGEGFHFLSLVPFFSESRVANVYGKEEMKGVRRKPHLYPHFRHYDFMGWQREWGRKELWTKLDTQILKRVTSQIWVLVNWKLEDCSDYEVVVESS